MHADPGQEVLSGPMVERYTGHRDHHVPVPDCQILAPVITDGLSDADAHALPDSRQHWAPYRVRCVCIGDDLENLCPERGYRARNVEPGRGRGWQLRGHQVPSETHPPSPKSGSVRIVRQLSAFVRSRKNLVDVY